jgi:hypothetical protein
VRLSIVNIQFERIAVQAAQAHPNIRHSDPGLASSVNRKCRAVIVDTKREKAAAAGGGNADGTSLSSLGNAMLDRIFNHRLQQKTGDLSRSEFSGHIDAQVQAFGESNFLNLKVSLRKFDFLG